MSTHLAADWFRALEHAMAARRVYPHDHPVSVQSLNDACKQLCNASANGGSEAHLLGDRVLVNGLVTRLDPHSDSLAKCLLRRGITCLRLSGPVQSAALAGFLDACARAGNDDLPVPEGLALGSGVGTVPHANGPVIARTSAQARQHAQTLNEGLVELWERGEIDLTPLLAIVEEVQAVATGARGTMIEMAALKSHDEYTYVHAVNVGLLAACLAEAVGLPVHIVRDIALSALMHDAGKRVITLEVLGKKGALSDQERTLMQTHPIEGAALLMGAPGVPALAPIIAYEHHMHLDGTGYPVPLPGRKPHIGSQIVQVADIFDALRTHRPYRPSMSLEQATAVLRSGSGTRFDPTLLDAFFTHVVPRSTREQSPEAPPLAA